MKQDHMGSNGNTCRWYDGTSGMKRAYDAGMRDRKWIDNYCIQGRKRL